MECYIGMFNGKLERNGCYNAVHKKHQIIDWLYT